MSVRPEMISSLPSLMGAEGELVSIRVCVEARLLEKLLDALAGLSFPVNPQIYHQAGVGYVYPDGREEIAATTLVEFPAFSSRVAEVKRVLRAGGLAPDSVHVRSMLEDIHADIDGENAPDGVPYRRVNFYRRLPVT